MEDSRIIYNWIKGNIRGKLPKYILAGNLDNFNQEFGCFLAIFVDPDEKPENFPILTYYNEKKGKISFWQIVDLAKAKSLYPELINLFIRNGRYLYTKFTKGKDLKIIEFKHLT